MALALANPETLDRFTALIVGPSGIGKTSLLRTINPSDGILVLSAEAGLLSVRDLWLEDAIKVVEILNIDDFQKTFEELKRVENQSQYKWIFIDSLTEIAAKSLEAWEKKYPDNKDSYNKWNGYEGQMLYLIKGFRDLKPYNVIFTCQESVKDLGITAEIKHKGLKAALPYIFDEVFYFAQVPGEKGLAQRVFLTSITPGKPGKDRSGKLAAMEHPHLSYLRDKILTQKGA